MINPNTNANDARARMRQQQYLRLALLLCMVMLLMDPSSTSNKSGVHRAGAKKASSLRGSGSGTSTGSTSYEKELATINQRFEVLLDPTDTKSLNTHMKIRFPGQKTPAEVLSAHNVTGVYRGAWSHSFLTNVSVPKDGTSTIGDSLLLLRPEVEGNSLIQLRSVPIHNVRDVKYVYGILKMYGVPGTLSGGINVRGSGLPATTLKTLNVSSGTSTSSGRPSSINSASSYASRLEILKGSIGSEKSTEDITYPVQGLHVPETSECLLVITPSRSHRVYIGVPSHAGASSTIVAGNDIERNSSENDSATSTPSPPLLNPDGTSRDESSKPNRQMQKHAIAAGGSARAAALLLSPEGGPGTPHLGSGKRKRQRPRQGSRRGQQVRSGDRRLHVISDTLHENGEDLPVSSLQSDNDNIKSQAKFSDVFYSIITAVWPLPISLVEFAQKLAVSSNTSDLLTGNSYIQEVYTSSVTNLLYMDWTGPIREAMGARSRNSTSLIAELLGMRKNNASEYSFSSLTSTSAVVPSDYDIESFNDILFDRENYAVDKPRQLQGINTLDSKDVELMHDAEIKQGHHVGSTHGTGKTALDEGEDNLFVLRDHLSLLPTDSFMKAVHRKATDSVVSNIGTKNQQSKNQNNIRTMAARPYFYAERYSLKTVSGLELLLVDVDHSSRTHQLPPHMVNQNKESVTAKKLSAQMEKAKAKFIPPSSIPGGLGAATMSNSFQSFLASTGVSSKWANTIRCTFAFRLLMSPGGHGAEDKVNAMLDEVVGRGSGVQKSGKHVKNMKNISSSSGMSTVLPQAVYEKHTKAGNDIRQLQGTLMGNVVTSACSYPLCSGRGLTSPDATSSIPDAHSISKFKHLVNSDQFSIVASFYKINVDVLESKLATYTFMYTIICFFQSYLLVSQMYASSNPAAASRISILSISAMAVLDAAICILHLLLSSVVSGNAFYYFLWLSFLKLVVFCILEMRFVISIYQARYAQEMAQNGWTGLRNHLATLHARFYGALFLVILLVDWYYTRPLVLVFVLYSFWLPQIAFSAYTGGPAPPLTLNFTTSMTISRLFFPLYTLACPRNFLSLLTEKFQINYFSAEATVAWLSLQIGIIFLQHKYGVRFFVPQYFLPVRYNYSRSVAHLFTRGTDTDQESHKECVICYNAVDQGGSSHDYMITPCDHLFHRECLSQWLNVKLECPVCRATLPLDED